MSPSSRGLPVLGWSFPRVSGDEPHIEVEMPASAQFSPRERG